jgi:hypothetical protein
MEKKNGNWTIKETKKYSRTIFSRFTKTKLFSRTAKTANTRQSHFVPGACVLPIDDEDFVYLTEQFQIQSPDAKLWKSSPARSKTKRRLKPQNANLKEELGITAEEMTEIGKIQLDNSIIKNEVIFTSRADLSFEKPDRDVRKK